MSLTDAGWTGLYCFQGRNGLESTAAFLNQHYPDGTARLAHLGDLITLGERPETCERMDEDEDYGPALDPDYPPPPCPSWSEALGPLLAIHAVVHFIVRWTAVGGWEAVTVRGDPLPE